LGPAKSGELIVHNSDDVVVIHGGIDRVAAEVIKTKRNNNII
jgi:hypothetical protein